MPEMQQRGEPAERTGKRKRRHHPRSLFGEILDWMLAPMLVLWPLSIGITYLVAQAIAAKPYDAALQHTLLQLAAQVQTQGVHEAVKSALWQQTLRQPPAGGLLGYQVRSRTGALLAGEPGMPAPASLPPARATAHLTVIWRDGEIDAHGARLAGAWVWPPAQAGASPTGPVLVQVAQSMEARTRLARDIVQGVILPQFVVVPIFILLVWFGLGQGIAPLNELQARIRRRRADDLSPIEEQEAPEEIAPLVDSINSLFARLQQSLQTQKRFVADAAHQIKTPLAGLRMQAELAQRETDPDELRASLRQIGRSVERTTRLVNQLLALTRAENQGGAARAVFETIDLRQPAAEAMQELAMLALDKKLELEFDSPPQPLPVRGNALLLQELIKNLLHNAITYTPPGGSVALRLRSATAGDLRAAPSVLLQVDDSGPGIPEAERALVFEPFYRILDNGSEGSGLGLAIVREIARQHEAEITLSDLSRGASRLGFRVQVQFARIGPAALG
ncbi:MAG: sensor histidine kinase N-terminal domain-containing protein [Thiomonas sp.]|uniref:sensor histidine kinase n=1 Tax=Thiomonas sp. TaxID=2047785 RepID=UPI002A367B9B|nr:sensor histidine kinase N-terminal domain-containing protein [Thiomonas sp.]MDY0329366.1 sensor histidine kinase N-terminal domain-containing protein [Thiomonas sp.]